MIEIHVYFSPYLHRLRGNWHLKMMAKEKHMRQETDYTLRNYLPPALSPTSEDINTSNGRRNKDVSRHSPVAKRNESKAPYSSKSPSPPPPPPGAHRNAPSKQTLVFQPSKNTKLVREGRRQDSPRQKEIGKQPRTPFLQRNKPRKQLHHISFLSLFGPHTHHFPND
ncbi:hypothetical protein N657DRAFT_205363 [Parathielavia appendiculata]|uniref:Uncharacterized protein n=1 Tax=Parathielavia appendiculata TaxID=2587402 RepID=A0AAN6Z6Y8_9PEZI|nr:hypothetical protein N657DRAFT_205363 [Parathielavia appendiculata]